MAKLTKKQYTRKRLFAGLAIFASVALVVTGVAVWLLFSGLSHSTGGNLSVGQVATSPLSFSVLRVDGIDVLENDVVIENAFVLDSLKDDNYGRVRFSGESYEKLKINVSGIVLNAQYLESFSYTLKLPDGVIEAAKKGYLDIDEFYDMETGAVKVVEVPLASGSIVNSEDGTASAWSFNFDVSLKWGSLFNYTNPSVYYDSEGIDVSNEKVIEILDDLRSTVMGDALHNPGFTLTVTASPNR